MGGKPDPPSPPDYGPLLEGTKVTAASDAEAAKIQAEVARESLAQQDKYAGRSADTAEQYLQLAKDQRDFGRSQYDQTLPYLQKYMDSQLDFTKVASDNAALQTEQAKETNRQSKENYDRSVATYDRYMQTYAPREDQFTKEAFDYASPARMEEDAAAARGDVNTAFTAQQDAAGRQLASYGVDPSQGAYGRKQAIDISKAAALAAAGTMARKQTEAQGKQYELAALQVGQKLPAQGIGYAGLGLQQTGMGLNQAASGMSGAAIGGGGIAAANQSLNSATNAMGSPGQYAALSNPYTTLSGSYGSQATGMYGNQNQALGNAGQALGLMGTTMNNMYSNQMEGYKAQAAASPFPAIGKAIGSVAPLFFA